ncbi:major facilitator superfamily domain-containing protein [Xylariaceae sp. FL0804]|nr:major facilitator superfamily domain-containing protein [Xylariaceae sp. FL0804]
MAAGHNETTPLLGNGHGDGGGGTDTGSIEHRQDGGAPTTTPPPPPPPPQPKAAKAGASRAARTVFGAANRILMAGFLMAFTLGITQVPIVYVFRVMECERFYQTHPYPPLSLPPPSLGFFGGFGGGGGFSGDEAACRRREISAGTATQYSILSMSTSVSGLVNLFVCGYLIKVWGPRRAFASQCALLALRVASQCVGVTLGGRRGEVVFQAFQAVGALGGPRGYQLVLNTAVGEAVQARDRTAVFGRLQGAIMLGNAFGYLLGGILGDVYNIRRPFETAFFLFVASTIYGLLFMPTGHAAGGAAAQKKAKTGISAFFAPMKIIVPHRYRLKSGRTIKNYGLIFLAAGIFLGVFASGYAPSLLQLYATSEFGFGTTENGYLMFGNASMRGIFLLFVFPRIIDVGREWFNGTRLGVAEDDDDPKPHDGGAGPLLLPTSPEDFAAPRGAGEAPEEPITTTVATTTTTTTNTTTTTTAAAAHAAMDADDEEEVAGAGFDLLFVRWSLLVDALVTFLAGLSTSGWQVYAAGLLLPFASGSAPAAKGVMTSLCPAPSRPDSIAAITLVENAATLLTQGLFGAVFAAFSEIGRPAWTFLCNAGFAVLGFGVLCFARLPPVGGARVDGDDDDHDDDNDADGIGNGNENVSGNIIDDLEGETETGTETPGTPGEVTGEEVRR